MTGRVGAWEMSPTVNITLYQDIIHWPNLHYKLYQYPAPLRLGEAATAPLSGCSLEAVGISCLHSSHICDADAHFGMIMPPAKRLICRKLKFPETLTLMVITWSTSVNVSSPLRSLPWRQQNVSMVQIINRVFMRLHFDMNNLYGTYKWPVVTDFSHDPSWS